LVFQTRTHRQSAKATQDGEVSAAPKPPRPLVAAGLIALLLVIFAGLAYTFSLPGNVAGRDFICYWTSAKLLWTHTNPYDRQAVLQIEAAAGASYHTPFLMRNPPWTLPLIAPLGLLSPVVGGLLWFASIIVAALASIRLIQPGKIPLVAYVFVPIVICVMMGQLTVFLLLAVLLFFRCNATRPFSAGLLLALLTIKPHLFLLLWPILLVECCRRREYRILAGAATGLIVTVSVALWFDPHVWTDYVAAIAAESIQNQMLPNISCLLRLIAPSQWCLQALPAGLGMLWAARYYWQRRNAWDWSEHGPLLLFISALVSPYSWPYDQALFLPAILQVLQRQRSPMPMRMMIALNAGMLVPILMTVDPRSPVYPCMPLAWFAWLLFSRRQADGA
jgi:hypothetical protein